MLVSRSKQRSRLELSHLAAELRQKVPLRLDACLENTRGLEPCSSDLASGWSWDLRRGDRHSLSLCVLCVKRRRPPPFPPASQGAGRTSCDYECARLWKHRHLVSIFVAVTYFSILSHIMIGIKTFYGGGGQKSECDRGSYWKVSLLRSAPEQR